MGQVAVCLLRGEWILTCSVLLTRSCCLCTQCFCGKGNILFCPDIFFMVVTFSSKDSSVHEVEWFITVRHNHVSAMRGSDTRRGGRVMGRRWGKLSILFEARNDDGKKCRVVGGCENIYRLLWRWHICHHILMADSLSPFFICLFPELLGSTKRLNINYQDSEG